MCDAEVAAAATTAGSLGVTGTRPARSSSPAPATRFATPTRRRCPAGFVDRLAGDLRDVVTDVDGGRRRQPRLVAAGAALGARRTGAATGRGARPPGRHDAGVAAVLAAVRRGRRAGHAAGGRSGVCGATVPVFGGVLLDLTAARSGSATSTPISGVVEVGAGDVRARPRARASASEHDLTIGHFPQSFEHRDRRRMGGVPRRRPVLDALRQDRGHGRRARGRARRRTRDPHGRGTGGRRRARPQRSCSSARRARSA